MHFSLFPPDADRSPAAQYIGIAWRTSRGDQFLSDVSRTNAERTCLRTRQQKDQGPTHFETSVSLCECQATGDANFRAVISHKPMPWRPIIGTGKPFQDTLVNNLSTPPSGVQRA